MVKHLRQIPLDTYKPLREVVIENIRDAILSGDFPVGMRLTELQLADEMGDPNPGSHPQLGTGRPCGHDSAARCLRCRRINP